MEKQPDYIERNRSYWDEQADEYAGAGRRNWADNEITWGIWGVPEADARLLPDSLEGLDVIELGCGTAYVAAWLARRGARVTGLDNSPRQLETARQLQQEHGLEFPLMLGQAENVPLPDASFDLVVSEYGAAIGADPYKWIPEAARLLRPGGQLIFLGNGSMLMLCVEDYEDAGPADEQLKRGYFGMYRFEWPDTEGIEFHLGYGDWIRLLRASGFDVEDLIELRAPEGATTSYGFVDAAWARRWPSEEVWKARKRPSS
ncbi:class I SAM-dependent methyltransferase [soil metagenome]